MNKKDIMNWFYYSPHEIVLTHNNKTGYIGIVIDKDTLEIFESTGKNKIKVLYDLRKMLNGTYNIV